MPCWSIGVGIVIHVQIVHGMADRRQRAHGVSSNAANAVGATCWTWRHGVVIQVNGNIGGGGNRTAALFVFQSPLAFGTVDFLQVADAGFDLSRSPGLDVIGYRDGCDQANNCDHDQNFRQREANLAGMAGIAMSRFRRIVSHFWTNPNRLHICPLLLALALSNVPAKSGMRQPV
jgi:hypothetical protein